MPALTDRPHHLRAAACRLVQALVGGSPAATRLAAEPTAGPPGQLAEVIRPGLFGPTERLTAFLCLSPRLGREDYTLQAFWQGYTFCLGRAGVLDRPGFRDPSARDVDPYHRLLADVPPREGADPASYAAACRAYQAVYTALIAASAMLANGSSPDDARRLLRLYQARALVNPSVASVTPGGGEIAVASLPPPRFALDRRLRGWDRLPGYRLRRLLDCLVPAEGEPDRLETAGELYAAMGWAGPPLVTGNQTFADAWLYRVTAPAPVDLADRDHYIELDPRPEPPLPHPNPAAREREFQTLVQGTWPPPTDEQREEMRQQVERVMGTFAPSMPYTLIPPPDRFVVARVAPRPAPPPPAVVDVDGVPEALFDAFVGRLTAALEGQADALPRLELEVTSDTGRFVKLRPTPPAPPPPPPPREGQGVRGIHLDE